MRFKKDKHKPDQDQSKKIAQEWLPFYDVAGGFLYRRDNYLVSVLKIEPMNIVLKSANEKKRIIQAVHEAWNAQLEPLQILSLPRPVDLDHYLSGLQSQARETQNPRRRKLLQDYLQYVAQVVRTGEAMERRYYILLSQKNEKDAKAELYQRAFELAGSLEESGLKVQVCDDRQILDMLFTFLNPAQAAFEDVPLVQSITSI